MYVISDVHEAVDMKPGSYVNRPVLPYSERMSTPSGPTVPSRIGNEIDGDPSENVRVAVRSVFIAGTPWWLISEKAPRRIGRRPLVACLQHGLSSTGDHAGPATPYC